MRFLQPAFCILRCCQCPVLATEIRFVGGNSDETALYICCCFTSLLTFARSQPVWRINSTPQSRCIAKSCPAGGIVLYSRPSHALYCRHGHGRTNWPGRPIEKWEPEARIDSGQDLQHHILKWGSLSNAKVNLPTLCWCKIHHFGFYTTTGFPVVGTQSTNLLAT